MSDYRFLVPWFLDQPARPPLMAAEPGDIMVETRPGEGDDVQRLAGIHLAVADHVEKAIAEGHRPFAILGDCCQTIGVMAGLDRSGFSPCLIWLDSHGDFNTWETTPSGFLGGMPLAMLTGRGDQRMLEAVALEPMGDGRVVLADARDLDPGERELVKGSGIRHVETLDALLADLPEGPIYLHFDSDIIDATEAPAFLYPVKGGPSADAMVAALKEIIATGRVVAVSTTVGWNPDKDEGGKTLATVRRAMEGLAEVD